MENPFRLKFANIVAGIFSKQTDTDQNLENIEHSHKVALALQETITRAYIHSIKNAPRSAFSEFILEQHLRAPQHFQQWTSLIGIPKLAALSTFLVVNTTEPRHWHNFTNAIVPLLRFYIFDAASDDLSIGVNWRPPDEHTTAIANVIAEFCNMALDTIQASKQKQPFTTPSIETLSALTTTTGAPLTIVGNSDSPTSRHHLIRSTFHTHTESHFNQIINSSIPSTLQHNLYALYELALIDTPTKELTIEGLERRYRAVRRLATDTTPRTPQEALRTGGDSASVIPSIAFMVGISSVCRVTNPEETALLADTNSFKEAIEVATRLIRAYNDLGTPLATSPEIRDEFYRRLKESISHRRDQAGTELFKVLVNLGYPADQRIAKDVRQGENNIALEGLHWNQISSLSLDLAVDSLMERLSTLATHIHSHAHSLGALLNDIEHIAGSTGAWASKLILAWEDFHRSMYSKPSDSFWGDYLGSDG